LGLYSKRQAVTILRRKLNLLLDGQAWKGCEAMAAFIVVVPAFFAAIFVFGYIGQKIPDNVYKTIGKVIFRCRI
jgi:hypothetical protein